MSHLEIAVEPTSEGALVRLAGDLNAATAHELRACIDDVEWPTSVTVLDVAELTFVDSVGIGCLMRLHQRVADVGGTVVAQQPSPQLRRLLEVTQLNRVIAVLD